MKAKFRIFSLLLILALCLFAFSACSGGIDRSDAKLFVEEFFAAVSAEDDALAQSYLHPDCEGDLSLFLAGLASRYEVDFSDGIAIARQTGFQYSFYNSAVDGSQYTMHVETKIGEKSLDLSVTVVQNDAGYGIYDLTVDE